MSPTRSTLFAAVLLAATFAGCGSDSPRTTPEGALLTLENRMMAADSVAFDFHITAEGLLEADLSGTAFVAREGRLFVSAEGTFLERPMTMSMFTRGDSLHMVTSERSDAEPTPSDLRAAVLLGITRMGLMHNLAQLSTASPPEHAAGGLAGWVTTENHRPSETLDGGVAFDLFVEGQQTARADLQFDDGTPTVRVQVVDFPGGTMTVTEHYSSFRVFDAP